MDPAAHQALRTFIRAELRAELNGDLDELAAELGALRRRVAAVEHVNEVPAAPAERRERAAELRAQGCSVRMIASVLGCHRATVQSDLEAAGVLPPEGVVVGADGRATRPRLLPPVLTHRHQQQEALEQRRVAGVQLRDRYARALDGGGGTGPPAAS